MNERDDSVRDDDPLIDKAKALFDESVSELDAATLSRLNRNRHEALEQAAKGRVTGHWNQWVPAAGVAAAAVFAVVIWTGDPPVDELTPPAHASDFEIILDGDDFEMLEDLEFYSWIELEEDDGSDPNVVG